MQLQSRREQIYSGGLTRSKNKPTSKSTMLKKPKNPVKLPNVAVLVSVKYKKRAPIIVSRSPKNFSARDSQKVSPSLMSLLSFSFLSIQTYFLLKPATVILYFRLRAGVP